MSKGRKPDLAKASQRKERFENESVFYKLVIGDSDAGKESEISLTGTVVGANVRLTPTETEQKKIKVNLFCSISASTLEAILKGDVGEEITSPIVASKKYKQNQTIVDTENKEDKMFLGVF